MNKEYFLHLYNKDGKLLNTIALHKVLQKELSDYELTHWQRIGNRSIIYYTKNNKILKIKGVGVEKYQSHYSNSIDLFYNKFISKTNIKYLKYQVYNPKLINLSKRNVIIVNQPYQEFIGEPIGGCGAKELRAFKLADKIVDKSILEVIPIHYFNIFTSNMPIYIVIYEVVNEEKFGFGKTLMDSLYDLEIIKQTAKTLRGLYDSHIVVSKDKNIVEDIGKYGLYKDLADTYFIENDKDLKLHYFGMLYNFFRLAFYEYSNLYKNTDFMKSVFSYFLSSFYSPSLSPNNNKKKEKRRTRLDNKAIKELDEIKIAYLIARILDLEVPTAKQLNYFLEKKIGKGFEAGDKLALMSYWFLDRYYHYNYSLEEIV